MFWPAQSEKGHPNRTIGHACHSIDEGGAQGGWIFGPLLKPKVSNSSGQKEGGVTHTKHRIGTLSALLDFVDVMTGLLYLRSAGCRSPP
jgi:hypothetical protein